MNSRWNLGTLGSAGGREANSCHACFGFEVQEDGMDRPEWYLGGHRICKYVLADLADVHYLRTIPRGESET